ncbi:MAG: hypothetical protein E6Q97_12415 [Desulfurellales bacterium]|nr:MAG: hypothetical protein E6Q97_12415 [Desulfurellales bacterium]
MDASSSTSMADELPYPMEVVHHLLRSLPLTYDVSDPLHLVMDSHPETVRGDEWWTMRGINPRGVVQRGHVEPRYVAMGAVDGFRRTPLRSLSRQDIARNIAVNGYPLPLEISHLVRWARRVQR